MTHATTGNTPTKDHLSELSASKPNRKRLSLLWRTVLLLAISVLICLGLLYAWIQHSVNAHFEQMDSEILEHARLVLEQQSLLTDGELALTQAQLNPLNPHRHALGLGYDLLILSFDAKGKFIGDLSQTSLPQTDLLTSLDLLALWQTHGERQFELITYQHHYRASILPVQSSRVQSTRADASSAQTNAKHQGYVLLALPIDVHHHYLAEFNRQLKVLLIPESVKPAPTLSLSPPASTF